MVALIVKVNMVYLVDILRVLMVLWNPVVDRYEQHAIAKSSIFQHFLQTVTKRGDVIFNDTSEVGIETI